jgi:hypothetical protein
MCTKPPITNTVSILAQRVVLSHPTTIIYAHQTHKHHLNLPRPSPFGNHHLCTSTAAKQPIRPHAIAYGQWHGNIKSFARRECYRILYPPHKLFQLPLPRWSLSLLHTKRTSKPKKPAFSISPKLFRTHHFGAFLPAPTPKNSHFL